MERKKKTTKKKHAGGRPPSYHESYNRQAEIICRFGVIDRDLAEFFKVSEVTINAWKKKYPKFLKSINKGKAFPNEQVKRALFERAIGYEHPDTHISNYQGDITKTEMIKHYPPDTAAAFIWLKNRDSDNWRDKHEISIIDITIGKPPELEDE